MPLSNPSKCIRAVEAAVDAGAATLIAAKRTRLITEVGHAIRADKFVLLHALTASALQKTGPLGADIRKRLADCI